MALPLQSIPHPSCTGSCRAVAQLDKPFQELSELIKGVKIRGGWSKVTNESRCYLLSRFRTNHCLIFHGKWFGKGSQGCVAQAGAPIEGVKTMMMI